MILKMNDLCHYILSWSGEMSDYSYEVDVGKD